MNRAKYSRQGQKSRQRPLGSVWYRGVGVGVVWGWALLLLLGAWGPAQAENIMDVLSEKGDELQSSSSNGLLSVDDAKKRLKEVQAQFDREKKSGRQEKIAKLMQERNKLQTEHMTTLKKQWLREDTTVSTLREEIARWARDSEQNLLKLQGAYSLLEQNLRNLRNDLKHYIDMRASLKKQVEERFPISKRAKLQRVMNKLKRKLREKQDVRKDCIKSLLKLNDDIKENSKLRDKAHKLMLRGPVRRTPAKVRKVPPKRVAPPKKKRRRRRRRRARRQKPPARRELSPAQQRKLERKKELKQLTEQLNIRLYGLKFAFYQERGRLLKVNKQDELLEKESAEVAVALYRYTLSLLKAVYRSHAAKAEGGLLYNKAFSMHLAVFNKVASHSTKLVNESPEAVMNFSFTAYEKLEAFQKRTGWWLFFLLSLVPFVLIALVILTRRLLNRVSRFILAREQEDTRLMLHVWRSILLMLRLTHSIVLYGLIFLISILVALALQAPSYWLEELFTLATTVLVLRGLWTLTNQCFAIRREERFISVLNDRAARRLRRLSKFYTTFAVFYLPSVQILSVLGYAPAFTDLLMLFFYATLVLTLFVALSDRRIFADQVPEAAAAKPPPPPPPIEEEDEEEDDDDFEDDFLFEEPDEPETKAPSPTPAPTPQRATGTAGFEAFEEPYIPSKYGYVYYFYPALMLVSVVIFGSYAWGYRNLSAFLTSGVLLTFLLAGLGYGINQILVTLMLRAFGFSKGKKAWFRLKRKIASRIVRIGRIVAGIAVTLLTIGLMMEAWEIPGGFRAVGSVINYPILQIQKTQVSVWSLIKFFLIFGGAIWLSKVIKSKLSKHIYPLFRMEPGSQHAANTLIGYIMIAGGVLLGLQVMGISIGVLAVFAGVVGIGIGFGLQNIMSNFISGLIITFGRPISVGDIIEVGGVTGTVQSISARSTTIETIDSRVILVPNSEIITTKVINWSLGPPYVRAKMTIGVAYGCDVKLVEETLMEIAFSHPGILEEPPPLIRFTDFGASSLDFALSVAVADPLTQWKVLSDLRFQANKRFQDLEIEIPFPQRDLNLEDDVKDALRALSERAGTPTTPSTPPPKSQLTPSKS